MHLSNRIRTFRSAKKAVYPTDTGITSRVQLTPNYPDQLQVVLEVSPTNPTRLNT